MEIRIQELNQGAVLRFLPVKEEKTELGKGQC
jgi:hypothetical protein